MSEREIQAMFLQICAMYQLCKTQKRKRRWKQIDAEQFFIQTRMSRPMFQQLLHLVGNELRKPKQRIGPEKRLLITLHFLAHGVCIQSLALTYKLGQLIVRQIILETCETLWRLLSPVYISEPSEQKYKDIAEDFKNIWNMPNCVGAIDGRHIAIKCTPKSGSLFDNYKKICSIVLMAACDAKYTFTMVSVGSYGSQSDGDVLKSCPSGGSLFTNKLPLPQSVPLSEGSSEPFPHFFVGDASFPLRNNLMRPYPGRKLDNEKRIFNYRLSRAHRVIENTFGILTTRWRVLRNTMEFSPENSESIVLACVVLHNFIMFNDHARWYCPKKYVDWEGPEHILQDGAWRADVKNSGEPLRKIVSFARRASTTAFQLRDTLANFFVNEGAVPFQNAFVR